MRKLFCFAVINTFFAGCVSFPLLPGTERLEADINQAAEYLNQNIQEGKKLAILNFKSDYPAFSEYVIDTLSAKVVNTKKLVVVERSNLSEIQQEIAFQTSGEVSDESAKAIGRMVGADIVVSGAMTLFGKQWRLTVRALDVESATVQAMNNWNIPNSQFIDALTDNHAGTKAIDFNANAASVQVDNLTVKFDGSSVIITAYTGRDERLILPASIKGHQVTAIGDAAFALCNNLIAIDIPDTVISIGEKAFMGCINLETVAIPDSVITIGNAAFAACARLDSVAVSLVHERKWGNNVFEGCANLGITAQNILENAGYTGAF